MLLLLVRMLAEHLINASRKSVPMNRLSRHCCHLLPPAISSILSSLALRMEEIPLKDWYVRWCLPRGHGSKTYGSAAIARTHLFS